MTEVFTHNKNDNSMLPGEGWVDAVNLARANDKGRNDYPLGTQPSIVRLGHYLSGAVSTREGVSVDIQVFTDAARPPMGPVQTTAFTFGYEEGNIELGNTVGAHISVSEVQPQQDGAIDVHGRVRL